MKSQAVVVRNTFLEVGDQQRSESFRRQVSEPVKIFSSGQNDDEEDSDEDFPEPAKSSGGGLRADAPVFQVASPPVAPATAWQKPPPVQEGYATAQPSGKQKSQGKGSRQKSDASQAKGSQSQGQDKQERGEAPRRLRDGQLSRLKDESITQMEPPWENVTTVMMRNLPNKYTQQMLLGELGEAGFEMQQDFDFFYLPMDHSNCANLGYCFINFTKTWRANDFAEAFSGKRMRRFNSHKTAVIMPASIQGYDANYSYYMSTRVVQAADPQYRPLFLRQPSDGVQVPAPLPAPSGKAQGKGGREDKGGKDGKGKRGNRRGGRDWEASAASEGGCGAEAASSDWKNGDDDDRQWLKDMTQTVVPPQMPTGPMQQDYQVVCGNCGTLCGSNYRFCSFCGAFLESSAANPMMMATYFQPVDWSMMPPEQQYGQSAMAPAPPAKAEQPQRNKQKSSANKATASAPSQAADSQEAAAEELDILHGRMMLLAALKVAGNQQGSRGHCDTPMSSEDEQSYSNVVARNQWVGS
eukprot:TRINITY_DN95949_c0_g1_i1.p1 TRINITY_DN95949_c0_g1~~TRINITY_DN95949_c0_g1_i1.p1  ORF type:complete len:524 (-),score=123.63 TRINITY_DN95949_c0_g1_i1:137-1708(-)